MYSFLSQVSSVLSKPFFNMANSMESWPIVFALGILIQRIAGFLMLILGIFDTLTYWSL